MDLAKSVEQLIISNLKQTIPAAAKREVNVKSLVDKSTRNMGFSKITRKGYTP